MERAFVHCDYEGEVCVCVYADVAFTFVYTSTTGNTSRYERSRMETWMIQADSITVEMCTFNTRVVLLLLLPGTAW